jgi:hypothetical protein
MGRDKPLGKSRNQNGIKRPKDEEAKPAFSFDKVKALGKALRRKRDRIEAAIAGYERKIKEAQADLAHVTASLRLFELSGGPSEFLAYMDLNRILRRGGVLDGSERRKGACVWRLR